MWAPSSFCYWKLEKEVLLYCVDSGTGIPSGTCVGCLFVRIYWPALPICCCP